MTPLELVNIQAEDDGLWFVAQTAAEAYLQQELRKLHESVEQAASAAPPNVPTGDYSANGEPLYTPPSEPAAVQRIVGYMVHGADITHAALYSLSARDNAFDAARRWNRSITAVVCASGGPDAAPPDLEKLLREGR